MAFSVREDTMPNSCQKSDVRVLESPSLSTHNDSFLATLLTPHTPPSLRSRLKNPLLHYATV